MVNKSDLKSKLVVHSTFVANANIYQLKVSDTDKDGKGRSERQPPGNARQYQAAMNAQQQGTWLWRNLPPCATVIL